MKYYPLANPCYKLHLVVCGIFLTFSWDDIFSALSNCNLLLSYLLLKCVGFSLSYARFNSPFRMCHSKMENGIAWVLPFKNGNK